MWSLVKQKTKIDTIKEQKTNKIFCFILNIKNVMVLNKNKLYFKFYFCFLGSISMILLLIDFLSSLFAFLTDSSPEAKYIKEIPKE